MLGYCMGGTMGAMFTALYPQWVKNLILLAAGIDFSTRGGLLNLWCQPEYFNVDAFVDAWGNCPAQFLQTGFLLLKPVANLIEKPLALWERLDDDRFVDEYLTMETWLADNIPVAGETFREFVKGLYQQNLLVQNRMRIGRRLVDLKQITCPVLNLMASRDDLVPCAAERAVQRPGELVRPADDQARRGPHRPGDGHQGATAALARGNLLAGPAELTGRPAAWSRKPFPSPARHGGGPGGTVASRGDVDYAHRLAVERGHATPAGHRPLTTSKPWSSDP